jgi:hypothetical protein
MDFKERVREYLLKKDEEDKVKHKNIPHVYHISSLGYCPRSIFFDKVAPTEESEDTKSVFLIGNIFHEWIQNNLLEGYKFEVEIEKKIESVVLRGRIDAINDEEIVELKTTNSLSYQRRPKEEHIVQINTYMGLTGIYKGKLVYIQKNDFDNKTFELKFNKSLFDETIKKIIAIDKQITDNVEYKDVIPRMSPNCYWCKNKQYCLGAV